MVNQLSDHSVELLVISKNKKWMSQEVQILEYNKFNI